MLLRNSSAPPRRASPEATRFALHWGTAIRCRHFCRHRLYSHLTTPHRRTPVSSRVSRPDFVPVSFSSFPFLCEDITLQRSRQDGVAGTVTLHRAAPAVLVVVLERERVVDCRIFLHLWLRFLIRDKDEQTCSERNAEKWMRTILIRSLSVQSRY